MSFKGGQSFIRCYCGYVMFCLLHAYCRYLYLPLNRVLVCVSIIFGLVLCFSWVISTRIVICHFCMPIIIRGLCLAERDSVLQLLFWFFDGVKSGVLLGRSINEIAGLVHQPIQSSEVLAFVQVGTTVVNKKDLCVESLPLLGNER